MMPRLFKPAQLSARKAFAQPVRSFSSTGSAANSAVAVTQIFPGFLSTCIVGYVGYNYMGGKELIEAKINNFKADTELKTQKANCIAKSNKP